MFLSITKLSVPVIFGSSSQNNFISKGLIISIISPTYNITITHKNTTIKENKITFFNTTKEGKGLKHWLNDVNLKTHSEIAAKGKAFAKKNNIEIKDY